MKTLPGGPRRRFRLASAGLLAILAAPTWGAGAVSASEPEEPAESGGETAGEAAAPASYENTIRWVTASEVDNFGFDVFRSESEDGPFERLNAEVIEGAGTTDEPTSYQYVDDTIDPRTTYFYYVESISMSGEREPFTPVGRAKPKIPPEGSEETPQEPPDEGGSGP